MFVAVCSYVNGSLGTVVWVKITIPWHLESRQTKYLSSYITKSKLLYKLYSIHFATTFPCFTDCCFVPIFGYFNTLPAHDLESLNGHWDIWLVTADPDCKLSLWDASFVVNCSPERFSFLSIHCNNSFLDHLLWATDPVCSIHCRIS